MTLYFLYGSKNACSDICRRFGINEDEKYSKPYKAYKNI